MRRWIDALMATVMLALCASIARPGAADMLANKGCPEFADRMNLKPDPDLLRWPISGAITPQEVTWGLQTVTQARRCEEVSDYQRAAGYYREAAGLLGRNLPLKYKETLMARANEVAAKTDRGDSRPPSFGNRDTDTAAADSVPHRDACTPSGYHGIFDEGIPPRKPAAIQLVEQACGLYTQGNKAGAAKLYRQAAEQYKDAVAQFRLGMLYERGEGVQQDLKQANVWLQRAADQGMQPASNELVRLNPPPPQGGPNAHVRRCFGAVAVSQSGCTAKGGDWR